MERSFSEALKHRRTYYSITNQSPIPDQEIECIVNMTVRHVPSAFNSQGGTFVRGITQETVADCERCVEENCARGGFRKDGRKNR